MNHGPSTSGRSPQQTLTALRVVWAALLLGQVTFGGVALTLVGSGAVAVAAPHLYGPLTLGVAAALAVLTPLGYFIRNQCYKAAWQQHAVAPAGYFRGNIVLLVMLESVATAALVTMLVTGRLLLPGVMALAAVAVQVINYPTGVPMGGRRPDFAPKPSPARETDDEPPTLK